MRLIKYFLIFILLSIKMLGEDKVTINFKDLSIMELIKVTSKVIGKNILLTKKISGNVNFISNKPIAPRELISILKYTLKEKGYILIENQNILRIIKSSNLSNNNFPVLHNNNNDYFISTTVISIKNMNVDKLKTKIKYLLSKNGKISTNTESNSFIITDYQDNIKTIKKVLSLISKDLEKNTLIIHLKNITATEAKKVLDLLSKAKNNGKINSEKVDIIPNKKDNSLILLGKKENIQYLSSYIKNFDKNDLENKNIVEVYFLKNIEVESLQKIIQDLIGKKVYKDISDKPLFSINKESNSVIVMGLKNEISNIKDLITKLDKEKAQVYIQARIIEVNDELINQIGISYGIFGGKASSSGLSTFTLGLNGGTINSLSNVTSALGLKIPDITSGLALGASINLLKQKGAINIVSEPSILALDNKESSIYVGETISIKTSSSVGSDGITTNSSFNREDIGLTLKVKPRITDQTKVTIEINTILEGVKTTQTISGNADTSKKEINTSAILNNGESVIIGGLIENKIESTKQEVPLLSDLPVLGSIFTNNSKNTKKNNLVIIITPYLIPKSKDITYLRNQLAKLKSLEDKYLKNSIKNLKSKKEKIITRKKYNQPNILETHQERIKKLLGR